MALAADLDDGFCRIAARIQNGLRDLRSGPLFASGGDMRAGWAMAALTNDAGLHTRQVRPGAARLNVGGVAIEATSNDFGRLQEAESRSRITRCISRVAHGQRWPLGRRVIRD